MQGIYLTFAAIGLFSFNLELHASTNAVPGEFIVRARNQVTNLQLSDGSKAVRRFQNTNWFVVHRPMVETQEYSLRVLNDDPAILYAEPNFYLRIHDLPNDPGLEKVWGIQNLGQRDGAWQEGTPGMDIQATMAWSKLSRRKSIIVAIVDTGIDLSHPDLQNQIWKNEAELKGLPDMDDDSNGYVDDTVGFDFRENDKDPSDEGGHGTHVAGIVGASHNNSVGIAGVSPSARLMAVKAFDRRGSGTTETAVNAIRYAVRAGAHVINCSWGSTSESMLLRETIEWAQNENVIFVASAGNSSADNGKAPQFPASYDLANVVSVAAVDNRGQLGKFSNFGRKTVHLAAPGVSVYSTVVNGYAYMSGTSMAAPFVSGTAALVWGEFPDLTMHEIKNRLLLSSRWQPGLRDLVITGGIISAYHALTGERPELPSDHPSRWPGHREMSISTSHPYGADENLEWEIIQPDALSIALHFDRFELEEPYDSVTVYDSRGRIALFLTGTQGEGWSRPIAGDRLRIVFSSDGRVNKYGFSLNAIAFR